MLTSRKDRREARCDWWTGGARDASAAHDWLAGCQEVNEGFLDQCRGRVGGVSEERGREGEKGGGHLVRGHVGMGRDVIAEPEGKH